MNVGYLLALLFNIESFLPLGVPIPSTKIESKDFPLHMTTSIKLGFHTKEKKIELKFFFLLGDTTMILQSLDAIMGFI